MCGIAGIYYLNGIAKPEEIRRMTDSLKHRGPDDEGFLGVDFELRKIYPLMGEESREDGPRAEDFGQSVSLMLGHRRLSIIDLSSAGHQPMGNEDGSLWIVHNGEIYNYVEIGKELESLGHQIRSKTDTEVILHSYEEWGVNCLSHFNGMWAFGIVDLKMKRIFCSRDRAGVKPLYFLYDGKRFCFASEIKALLKIDGITIEPNKPIVADYLLSGLLDHTQETFFNNIYQLRPGEYLLMNSEGMTIQSYWDIESQETHFSKESDYADQFYELFQDAIRLRLRSDVPIGTCLSGGLDSSSIVCLANRLMFNGQNIAPRLVGERQKTFSSCFEDDAYDERKFIELVIQQTGAEKNYVFPRVEALCADLPNLIWSQDEPFGSTSIYAQWMVMKLAKERGVTVLLDGQGADELLAGYTPAFYHLFVQSLKGGHWGQFVREVKAFKNRQGIKWTHFPIGMIAAFATPRERFNLQRITKNGMGWADKDFVHHYFRPFKELNKFKDVLKNYLYQAFRFIALPGLLHYEDRNSMIFSLETRLPFLDYRMVEYIFSLPLEQKIGGGVTKVVLRRSMKGILPERVRNRMDKMGFSTPMNFWLREALREWILGILESKTFAKRGYFHVPKVKELFAEHNAGKKDHSSTIWRWVNLELWSRTFIDRTPSAEGLEI